MKRRDFFKVVAGAVIGSMVAPAMIHKTPLATRAGFYGYATQGAAIIDNRRVLLAEMGGESASVNLPSIGSVGSKPQELPQYNITCTPDNIVFENRNFERIPLFDAEGILFGVESGV